MVVFPASGSGAVVISAFRRMMAGYSNILQGKLLSRALTGNYRQCSMYTKQSTILMGSHSA